MSTGNRVRLWLMGATAGMLIALVIASSTRWLVTSQVGWQIWPLTDYAWVRSAGEIDLLGGMPPPDVEEAARQLQRLEVAADRYPRDYQIQLAYAVEAEPATPSAQIERLQKLAKHFPITPSVYANILRYQSADASSETLDGEIKLMGPDPSSYQSIGASSAEKRAGVTVADQGERLVPDNAFFPQMRAYWLFALHRNHDAIQAVLAAGNKTRWDDYSTDEAIGRWRLDDAAGIRRSAIARLADGYASSPPDLSLLFRATAAAAYEASLLEQKGQKEAGLRIRLSLIRTASLMRTQSRTIGGAVVGTSMENLAILRLNGSPDLGPKSPMTAEKQRKRYLDRFVTQLQRLGQNQDIPWIKAEYATRSEVLRIINQGLDTGVTRPVMLSGAWQLANILTLANAFWLLLLAGLDWVAWRSAAAEKPKARRAYVRWGIGLAVAAGVLFAVARTAQVTVAPWVISSGVALLILLAALAARPGRYISIRGQWAVSITIVVIAGILFWQFSAFEGINNLWYAVLSMANKTIPNGMGIHGALPADPSHLPDLYSCLALVAPVLVLLGVAITNALRRRFSPKGRDVELRSAGLVGACVLLLVYGLTVIGTARQDTVAKATLWKMLHNEGQTCAQIIGAKWPGPVK